jgi:iron complex transport system substrate-binding protein
MRVVSLLPSATETVCALGRRSALVGRSEECDFPPEVRELPVVMRARTLDSSRPSAEIDARVRATRSDDQSLYDLDVPLLTRLAPDLVLTQDLCRVCSVTDAEVLQACQAARLEPRLVSLTPRDLPGVWDSIDAVGQAIGAGAAATRLSTGLRRAAARAQDGGRDRPRVAVLEWVDPPILVGLWGPDIIVAAGGTPVRGASGQPGIRVTWPELQHLAPDLVVVSPCSFGVARTRVEIAGAQEPREGLDHLAPSLGVWLADEAFFSRPGPRLGQGIRLLSDLIAGRRPHGPMPVERWEPPGSVR